MNDPCSMQERILLASRDGNLSAADREHLATCADCTDAVFVDTLLREEGKQARFEAAPAPLETVAPVLWQGLSEVSARRARVLTLILRLSGAGLSTLGIVVAGLWALPRYGAAALAWLQPAFGALDPTLLLTRQESVWGLVAAVAGLGLAMLTHGLWASWAEAD
jgi:hypothetical protein